MENATDALKMAAAVLIFVGALSLAIIAFTKATQAATAVLSRTKIQYYDTNDIRVESDRIVGIETVIPTLYAYFNEGYTILFYEGTMDTSGKLKENTIKPLTVYYSEALDKQLELSTLVNKNDGSGAAIYGFDLADEDTRQEPWKDDPYPFIKSFIDNAPEEYDMSRIIKYNDSKSNNKYALNFTKTTFYDKVIKNNCIGKTESLSHTEDAVFIERIGTYIVTADIDESDQNQREGDTDSSVITFNNGESIENTGGTQKRVIQYIYIGKRSDNNLKNILYSNSN